MVKQILESVELARSYLTNFSQERAKNIRAMEIPRCTQLSLISLVTKELRYHPIQGFQCLLKVTNITIVIIIVIIIITIFVDGKFKY